MVSSATFMCYEYLVHAVFILYLHVCAREGVNSGYNHGCMIVNIIQIPNEHTLQKQANKHTPQKQANKHTLQKQSKQTHTAKRA